MKVLKTNCKTERVIQDLENYMQQRGISIDWCNGLRLTIKGKEYVIVNMESPTDILLEFPRTFDSERLRPIEDMY
jgi:hypothetical protein